LNQLQHLLRRHDTVKQGIKIAITSRPHVQVESHLTDLIRIPLTAEDLRSDITSFVEARVHELRFTGTLVDEVRQALIDGADGMFLWVSLILEDFKKATRTTPRAIRKRLKDLPRDLHAVYENILHKINTEDHENAANILQWVTWAMRPLTLEELTVAIAIRPGKTSMSSIEDDMETELRHVLTLFFGPMLKIEPDDTVHLVHQSAKDFLIERNFLPAFRLSPMECNMKLGLSCLTYLSFEECEDGPVAGEWDWHNNAEIERRQQKMPLLTYAAAHWPTHTRQTDQARNIQQTLSSAFRALAQSPGKFDLAYQLFEFSQSRHFVKTAPLCQAASLGLVAFVEGLLEVGADVNAEGGLYGNALQAAAENGNEAVVRLLVEKGADINAEGGSYGNALQAAAQNGNEAVVRLLIEKGADVNAEGGDYGNTLTAAAANGNEAVVRLLIEKGADVNAARRGLYGNALHAAAWNGNEAVVWLLIEKGADVNAARRGLYGNALQAAAENGNEAVVRLLVEKGAEINAEGGYYGNALQAAAKNGNEAVVRLLIEKGADVNAEGGLYGNVLQAAAENGDEAVVRLLVEKGADVNAEGGNYGNALQAAAANGNEAVVRLLLEKGADVNAEGGDYGNTLRAAAANGNEAVIRLLIEKGAVNADRHLEWFLDEDQEAEAEEVVAGGEAEEY
jgi:ankyrin repeat protein